MGKLQIIIPEQTQNLIINPSVEDDTTGYSAAALGALARETTEQRFGLYGITYTPTATVDDGLYYTIALSTTTEHTFSCYVLGVLGINYRIYAYDVVTGVVIDQTTDFVGTGEWERQEVTFTTLASTNIRLYLTKNNEASVADFYTDGWQCEEKSFASTYCDGDQVGCTWDGLAHGSKSTRPITTRQGGKVVDLTDDVPQFLLEFGGLGMPPNRHNTQELSLQPGAVLESIKQLSRVISIPIKTNTDNESAMYNALKELYNFIKIDAVPNLEPLILIYSGTTNPVTIEAYYQGGLEGIFKNECFEEGLIRFIAYSVFFEERGSQVTVLTGAQLSTDVEYDGLLSIRTDDTWSNLGFTHAAGGAIGFHAVDPSGNIYATSFSSLVGGATPEYHYWNNNTWAVWPSPQLAGGADYQGSTLGIIASALDTVNNIIYMTCRDVVDIGITAPLGGIFKLDLQTGVLTKFYDEATDASPPVTADTQLYDTIGYDSVNGTVFYASRSFALGISGGTKVGRYIGGGPTPGTDLPWASMGVYNNDVHFIFPLGDGRMLIGGLFTVVDANPVVGGAIWNENTTTLDTTTLVFNGQLHAAAISPSGEVFLGGAFTDINGSTYNKIVIWEPTTDKLTALPGGGITGGDVWSLFFDNEGVLWVGGDFTTAGGLAAQSLVKFNQSSFAWSTTGANLDSSSRIVDIIQDTLENMYFGFTGGNLTAQVPNTSANVINTGTSEAFPKIIIKRTGGTSATLRSVTNNTIGAELLFNYAMADGEIVTIDLTPTSRTITSSSFGNIFNELEEESDLSAWKLITGDNAISVITEDAGGPTIEVFVTWTNKHWSVVGAN